jgi:hypothetical protein
MNPTPHSSRRLSTKRAASRHHAAQGRRRALPGCLFGAALLVLLCACDKHDAAAGSLTSQFSHATQQAGQTFNQAANAMGEKVDAAASNARQTLSTAPAMPDLSIDEMASSAHASAASTASATSAAVTDIARSTGRGLATAGQKLQAVASSSAPASAASEDSGVSASSSRE